MVEDVGKAVGVESETFKLKVDISFSGKARPIREGQAESIFYLVVVKD